MTIVEACESRTNTTPDFPMGWYCVGRSHELQIGEVTNVGHRDFHQPATFRGAAHCGRGRGLGGGGFGRRR